jgi:hypothetical protein
MTISMRVAAAAATAAASIVLAASASVIVAAPAGADPDIDFADQLHEFGIYGARDYNAWLGKIACKRLARGVDTDAYSSANFIERNLDPDSTTAQALQFLGAAISIYCPDQSGVLQSAAQ